MVACQEDEEATKAAERSRHYKVATHKLGHSVHPGVEMGKTKWVLSHLAISGLERPYPTVKPTQGNAARWSEGKLPRESWEKMVGP